MPPCPRPQLVNPGNAEPKSAAPPAAQMTVPARMSNDPAARGLASTLVGAGVTDISGGGMLRRELATCAAGIPGTSTHRRLADRRRGPLTLLTAVTSGLTLAREPRTARDRFEQ